VWFAEKVDTIWLEADVKETSIMSHKNEPTAAADLGEDQVFERAAQLFAMLATPMRLRILSALCETEKSVTDLLLEIDTTQPNLSQHLNVLYRAGILARRKEGTRAIYRVQSQQAVGLCRSVCTSMAIEWDEVNAPG